jgi:hypothetical protein
MKMAGQVPVGPVIFLGTFVPCSYELTQKFYR